MRPQRILFVDHVTRILGGAEINLIELLEARPSHWTVACACANGSRLGEALKRIGVEQFDYSLGREANQLRVVGRRFSPAAALRGWLALKHATERLDALLTQWRPNLVVTCTNKDGFAAGPACRRAGVPCVWWVNDVMSADFFSWPVRATFRNQARRFATKVIAVSNFARQALLELGLAESQVVTIHNGIPIERYQRKLGGLLRKQLGVANDEPIIGLIGRYTPWKGGEFFIDLAARWAAEGRPGRFVLVGHAFNEDQPFEHALRRQVEDAGLAGRVHFFPFQDSVVDVLSDLDVLIHASLRPEPFGRVIIEAMAAGVPVIAARAGGVPEIVSDQRDGLLAEPGDLEDYKGALEWLTENTERRMAIGSNGQQTVVSRFAIGRVSRDFGNLGLAQAATE